MNKLTRGVQFGHQADNYVGVQTGFKLERWSLLYQVTSRLQHHCSFLTENSYHTCTYIRLPFAAAIGFNVESVTYKNVKFQVWDLGGQTSIRPYWRCYYPNTQAIIYVVDSSDTERIGTSQEEFHAILQEEELKDALLLIYANKQVHGTTCRKPHFTVISKHQHTFVIHNSQKCMWLWHASDPGMLLAIAPQTMFDQLCL